MKSSRRYFILGFLVLGLLAYAATEATTVYVTPNGKKYHTQTCRTIAKSKTVTAITKDEAIEQGYTACKVCKP
jgi:hypothetical protein